MTTSSSPGGHRGPGLDVAALTGLLRTRHPLDVVIDRIRDHLRQHRGYVAFSGGKDSLVVLHLARQADPAVPVVFFDSRTEFPETYAYVHDLAAAWDLNWHTIPAARSPLEMMVADGAWTHRPGPSRPVSAKEWFDTLITRPAATAHDLFGPGELWGVRADESSGRRAAYHAALARTDCDCASPCAPGPARRLRHGGVIARRDATVAYGPIWDWTTQAVWAYIRRHQLPVNPVYQRLVEIGAPADAIRLSHALDVARLDEGQLVWLKRGWPQVFATLADHLPRLNEMV